MGRDSISAGDRSAELSCGGDLSASISVSKLGEPESEPLLRVQGVISNARPDHRLRLHVALPAPARMVVAGSPFELVERPLVSEGSDLEAPSSTWPTRGVVMAGGLVVLTEGVVEYEVAEGREI